MRSSNKLLWTLNVIPMQTIDPANGKTLMVTVPSALWNSILQMKKLFGAELRAGTISTRPASNNGQIPNKGMESVVSIGRFKLCYGNNNAC